MASEKISTLTKEDIIRTARRFTWSRSMPKWTAIVDGRELPARPLVLDAAGVPPNDPTNSHQAVARLKSLGFQIRYEGRQDTDFSGSGTENANKVWETQISGRTYTFKKAREKEGVFVYSCERRTVNTVSATSFYSERDLNPEEVERLSQFSAFISANV